MGLNFPTEHNNEKVVVLEENLYLLDASRQCESSFTTGQLADISSAQNNSQGALENRVFLLCYLLSMLANLQYFHHLHSDCVSFQSLSPSLGTLKHLCLHSTGEIEDFVRDFKLNPRVMYYQGNHDVLADLPILFARKTMEKIYLLQSRGRCAH